jgi:hypothetical protein
MGDEGLQTVLKPARSTTGQAGVAVDAWIEDQAPSAARTPRAGVGSAVELSPVGWVPAGAIGVKRWIIYGKRFARLSSASNWWIGDWMRYGNERYGEKYGAAAKATGYDRQTLMNMAYVASRFSVERRRCGVSWSHHAELAALPVTEQDSWLDLSEREHLTVRSLRDEVRRGLSAPRKSNPPADGQVVIAKPTGRACPYCGCPMPPGGPAAVTNPLAHAPELRQLYEPRFGAVVRLECDLPLRLR